MKNLQEITRDIKNRGNFDEEFKIKVQVKALKLYYESHLDEMIRFLSLDESWQIEILMNLTIELELYAFMGVSIREVHKRLISTLIEC